MLVISRRWVIWRHCASMGPPTGVSKNCTLQSSTPRATCKAHAGPQLPWLSMRRSISGPTAARTR